VPALGVTDSAIVAFEGWLRTVTLQKLTTGHANGDKRQRIVSFSTRAASRRDEFWCRRSGLEGEL